MGITTTKRLVADLNVHEFVRHYKGNVHIILPFFKAFLEKVIGFIEGGSTPSYLNSIKANMEAAETPADLFLFVKEGLDLAAEMRAEKPGTAFQDPTFGVQYTQGVDDLTLTWHARPWSSNLIRLDFLWIRFNGKGDEMTCQITSSCRELF